MSAMPRRLLLIANRRSRRCADCLPIVTAALQNGDFGLTTPDLSDRTALTSLIIQHAPHHDGIVLMGGDGTINAALPGVLAAGLPVGIIPTGTANDLARTLELPLDPADAVEVITGAHTQTIDVAAVNGVPFVNAASLGLTVGITQQLTRDLKRRWGVAAYLIACTRAVLTMRRFGAEIQVDDQTPVTVRSVQIVVGNGRYFGGGMTVDESARIDDGVLHVYSINAPHWWSMLTLLPALRRGTTAHVDRIHNTAGQTIIVRTKHPKRISADGEIVAMTTAEFSVRPQALRVFVPKPSSS